MKILIPVIALFLFVQNGFSQTVFINEINYKGNDTGVEIAGPQNTNLQGWSLLFYEGSNEKVYMTVQLSGIIDGEEVYWFPITKISIGHPKGAAIALIDNNSTVVDFISYGGSSFVAKDGLASGISTYNIGVEDPNSIPELSVQKTDAGWEGPKKSTPGKANSNKTLSVFKNEIKNFKCFPNPVIGGTFSIVSDSYLSKKIELYSINGQLVLAQNTLSNQPINVQNLSTGVYILKVVENGKISVQKLLVN